MHACRTGPRRPSCLEARASAWQAPPESQMNSRARNSLVDTIMSCALVIAGAPVEQRLTADRHVGRRRRPGSALRRSQTALAAGSPRPSPAASVVVAAGSRSGFAAARRVEELPAQVAATCASCGWPRLSFQPVDAPAVTATPPRRPARAPSGARSRAPRAAVRRSGHARQRGQHCRRGYAGEHRQKCVGLADVATTSRVKTR